MTEGRWYPIKVLVKPPCSRAVWVPLLVLHTPETEDYEITQVEAVKVSPGAEKPTWGNPVSEIAWLQRYAKPDLWKQIIWRVWEQKGGAE